MVIKTLENAVGGRPKAGARVLGALLLAAVIGLLALTGTGQQAGAQTAGAWGPPVNLSVSDTASLFPDIAVDNAGHVYVVWGEHSSDDVVRSDMLLFRMWDGQTWSPPNDIAVGGHLPQIAVDSQGRLHVIRIANGLEYKRAWAQGDPSDAQAWTPGQDLHISSPYWPDMVVDSQDRIHVVFTDVGGIHYRRSVDGGDSWSVPIQLDIPRVEGAETPRLAVDGLDNVYAVWSDLEVSVGGRDPMGIAVGFSYSTDGGETWSLPRQVVTGDEGYEWPQVAVDSAGTIHVVWRYRDLIAGTIGYVRSSDRGESWSEVENLRLGSTGAYSFGLAVDSADNLHLVMPLFWGGLPMGVSHLVRPPGAGWSPPTRISQNPCNAASADAELVISQGNRLHAVWYDRLECNLGFAPPSGRGEVFYSSLTTDASATPQEPLPPMPTAAIATATVVPIPEEPSPTPTATAAPRRPERDGNDAATQPVRSPMALGIGMSIGFTTVVLFLWSIARHSHRYR
jgi:hypothetical protein